MKRPRATRNLCLVGLIAALSACGAGDHNPWYPSPGNDGPPPAACLRAREQRARLPGLLSEGKLGRALRLMQFAEGACPTEEQALWASHVTALAAVGRTPEARNLAARIARSDRATEDDRRAATKALADAEARLRALLPGADVGPPRPPFRWTADDDTRFEATWTTKERAVALFQAGALASAKSDYAAAKQRFLEAWATSHPNPRALYEAGLAAESMGDKVESQRLWDQAAFDGAEAARPELPNGAPVGAFDARLGWSGAGNLLALASEGQISVYDTKLRLRRRIDAREQVRSVAFSPDETELFAGLESGHIRRYHLMFDTARHDLDAHTGPVTMMTIAPDGQRIATAGSDGTLRVWGGEKSGLKVLPLPPGVVVDLAWSGNGDLLAFAQEGKIGVFDTRTFSAMGVMEPHSGVIRAISFGFGSGTNSTNSTNTKNLSVVTATHKLLVDAANLKGAPRVQGKTSADLAAARPTAVAVANATEVTVKAVDSGRTVAAIPITPSNSLLRMALSPDGKTLAAAFLGHTLRLYPVGGGQQAGAPVTLAKASSLESLAISPDGKVLATGSEDGGVALWRTAPAGLRILERAADAGAHARALTFSPDGKLLAVGRDTGAVSIVETEGLGPRSSFRAEAAVLSLGFSPDSARVAVGTDTPVIVMLTASTGAPFGELRLNTGAVRALAFSKDGRSLLSASQEGVTLWDPPARKGARYVAYGQSPHDLTWSPDGSSFAVATSSGTLALGSTANASASQVVPVPAHVLSVAYADNGSIATAEADRSIVYRTSAGKLIQRFREVDAPVWRVAFTRDGAIVGAYGDGSLRMFRPPLARAIAVLRVAPGAKPGAEAGVAMTPAGHIDFIGDGGSGRAGMSCRIGAMLYPFAVCAEQFVVPGLLKMALAGLDPAEAEP